MSKYPDGHRYMKNCLQCDSKFRTFPAEERKGGGKFCSQQCGREYRSEQARIRNTRICGYCEKGFVAPIQNIIKGNGKYCSRLCQNRAIGEQHLGENHPNWKGDEVGYMALHSWVKKKLGKPSQCSNCGIDGLSGHDIHWANISQDYLRDLKDWARLCAKCHKNYDKGNIILNLQGAQ